MDLFDSINNLTSNSFGSMYDPYKQSDPYADMVVPDQAATDAQKTAAATQPDANKQKPPATGAEIANKAAEVFKTFGAAVGNKPVNLQPTQVNMAPPNVGQLAAMSQPQQMAPMPQLGMPQMQVPQIQAPMMMPQMPMQLPPALQMSDYRTKQRIQDASIKLDALLNKVYENLTNRK